MSKIEEWLSKHRTMEANTQRSALVRPGAHALFAE